MIEIILQGEIMALTLRHFYHQSRPKYKLRLLTPSVSLHQKITWIHLLEDINNCSFIRGGELIITTGLNANKDHLYLIWQPESIPAAPPV